LLSPEEKELVKSRYRYFRRISRETAQEKTVEWFKLWFWELAQKNLPEDHLKEVVEFLHFLEETS